MGQVQGDVAMKIINGNIAHVKHGIIIHQANNRRVMGAGVAKAITDIYPQHKRDYLKSPMVLGTLVCSRVTETLGIVAMIAQDGYGRNKDIVYTDYEAFKKCLIQIKDMHDRCPDINYYMPYKIGCGLANGDWHIVEKMIIDICPFIIFISKLNN